MQSFFSNLFLNFWPETKFFLIEKRGVNIDQIEMCYIKMDLSQRALQTNEKLFYKLVFKILAENQKFWSKTEQYSKELRGMNID